MTAIREPAVAGLFYPGDRASLAADVDRMLAGAVAEGPAPKALIVPHAGYPYSGSTAAAAFASIRARANGISRVVLLGPAHRVPFRGIAAPSAEMFATPLGSVGLDRLAIDRLIELPQVVEMDLAHEGEHGLEVQLPFLQRLLGAFELVPLVVGDCAPDKVAEVLRLLWGGPETLVLISSDLSHYLDYDTAVARDRATSAHIEALDRAAIGHGDACGRNPINGLIAVARERGMRVETLAYCNSGDTAGDKRRVVGYGAYAVYDTSA